MFLPRATTASIALAVLAVAVPARAATVQVQSLTGVMHLHEEHCAVQGARPCETATLDVRYAARRQVAQPARGRGQFARGLAVGATVDGTCVADSPGLAIQVPHGPGQWLAPAERVDGMHARATNLLVDLHRTRVRIGWRDPLAPPVSCSYLADPMIALAVRTPSPQVPASLTSRWVSTRRLAHGPVRLVIAGSYQWELPSAPATGFAFWRLAITLSTFRPPTFAG
jgi:hypothetical protein